MLRFVFCVLRFVLWVLRSLVFCGLVLGDVCIVFVVWCLAIVCVVACSSLFADRCVGVPCLMCVDCCARCVLLVCLWLLVGGCWLSVVVLVFGAWCLEHGDWYFGVWRSVFAVRC